MSNTRRQFVLPDELMDALEADAQEKGISVTAALVLKLSAAYGLNLAAPKRGGRRVPNDLTPDELERIKKSGE